MSLSQRFQLTADCSHLGKAIAFVDEVYAAIHKGPLFEEFSRQEISALCQYMHCHHAPVGVTLLREGDQGDYMLVILTGKVSVCKHFTDGSVMDIAEAGPGTTLGEMALIDGESRFADCMTLEPTNVAHFSRSDLNEILANQPRLANKLLIKLMQVQTRRLRDTGLNLMAHYPHPAPKTPVTPTPISLKRD